MIFLASTTQDDQRDEREQSDRRAGGFQDARADREGRERRRAPGFEVLLRRFFRETQQSRILSITKQKRYKSKGVSRKVRRASAVRKERIRRLKRGY